MSDFFFNALVGAAGGGAEQPVDGQTGVWLKSGGVTLSSAMKMTGATIAAAQQFIYDRGTAMSCLLSSGGTQFVSSGGTANGCLFFPGGSAFVSSGGTVIAASILGGWVAVRSFGVLLGATLSGGQIVNYNGGRVVDITILTGNMPIWAPAPFGASNVTIRGGNANVGYGGYAFGVVVSGGSLLMSAGSASTVTISSGGIAIVSSGGTALSMTISSGGLLTISSGGSALAVTSNAGAVVTVIAGGYIEYA